MNLNQFSSSGKLQDRTAKLVYTKEWGKERGEGKKEGGRGREGEDEKEGKK